MILEIREDEINNVIYYYVPIYRNDWVTWSSGWVVNDTKRFNPSGFYDNEHRIHFNSYRNCVAVIRKKYKNVYKINKPSYIRQNYYNIKAYFKAEEL